MRWFVFCLFIASMSLTLIGLAVDVVYHTSYTPIIEKWQNRKSNKLEHYLQEKSFFSKHNIFSISSEAQSPQHDFAEFLHSRIASDRPYIAIPLEKQAEVLSMREKWVDRKFILEVPQAVIEIFNRAQDYKFWNIQKTLEAKKDLSAREFIVAGQLVLIDSLKDENKDPSAAIKKVRHFARLLLSCENLNYKLAGLSLLSKEQEFLGYVDKRMPAQKMDWETIPLVDLKRFRNFLYMTYDYFDFLMPPALLDKIFIQDQLPTGFCSVFRKKEPILSRAAPLLKGFFPFEPSFGGEHSTYLAIRKKAKEKCQTPITKPSSPLSQFATNIPFYRRIKALRFLLNNKSLSEGT